MQDFKTPIQSLVMTLEIGGKGTRHTTLLVDTQRRNPRTRAPGRQIGHFVHQHSQRVVLLPQHQNSTQVFWYPLESLDILPNQLWRAVVVIDNRADAIHDSVVGLHQPRSNPKKNMNQRIRQLVSLRLDKRPNRRLSRDTLASLAGCLPLREVGWIGEIWLQKGFSIRDRELPLPRSNVISEHLLVLLRDHGSGLCVWVGGWLKKSGGLSGDEFGQEVESRNDIRSSPPQAVII